jgi:hypothetical protein
MAATTMNDDKQWIQILGTRGSAAAYAIPRAMAVTFVHRYLAGG